MINRTNFNLLLRVGLRKDFRDSYKAWEEEYNRYLHTGNMDNARVEAATMSGTPRQVALGELEPFTLIDPEMSDKVSYIDTPYGLGFGVSREMTKDDEYGKARQSAKWLGRSVRLTQEYESADLLNDAFTGTVFTGLFGEPLISATHQLLGTTGTWNNLITGNPQLGILGLQAAFEVMERSVDQNGDPIVLRMDKLVIGVPDEWMAIQLTQNPDEPFTANRNVNALRRKRQLSYMISHFMTQTGRRWFGQDSMNHDAHFLFKERPSFPEWYENMIRAWIFASYQRFLVYFYDQRGWVGSNAT